MKPIRIFISSPGDVAEERDKAEAVIRDLDRHYSGRARLVTVRWENLGLGAHASFQEGIVKVLTVEGGVDIAVFILWSRLGTPQGDWALRADGKPYRSGTEQEFDLMLEACRESGGQRPHLLAYVRDDDRAYSAALANAPVTEHSKIVEQRTLARQFVSETFSDAETGRNLRAFHTYDQPVTFADRLRVHLRAVLDRILGDDPGAVRWDERPYRGLEVFDVAHEDIFRGREEQVCEVLRQLRRNAAEGCAFAVIVGASGSGKSSLARAGVAPSLLHHAHDDAKEWRHAIFTPSLAPGALLAGLAEVLAAPGALPELRRQVRDLADLAQSLATDPVSALKLALLPALRAAREAAGGPVRLILVVDQMEELFVPGRVTEEERAAFLRAIETLARHVENGEPGELSGEPPFRVLATLRSDFYAAAQRDETFLRLKGEHGHFDLLPPDPAALQRIIVEPARLAGLEFEERDGVPLDRRLLAEAVRGADALPLLEYALDALYEQRDTTGLRPLLTHAAYDAMGGVEGALGGQAEKVFTSLPEEARAAFGPVMQELVTVDASPEAPPLRQRVPLATLRDTPAKETLVNALLNARFLTADSDARTGEAVAGLAHEALLRRWDRLAVWIEANREHLRVRARVEQSQARWERDDADPARRDPSLLLPEGLPLEEARALLCTTLPRTGSADYIYASIAHLEAIAATRRRIRRNVITVLSLLLIVALAATWWALAKQKEAKDHAARAQKQVEQASINDYATAREHFARDEWRKGIAYLGRSLSFLPQNRAAAFTLWQEIVYGGGDRDPIPLALLPHEEEVIIVAFSPDGSRIVTVSKDDKARLWDAATGQPLGDPLRHEHTIRSVAFSPDGSRIVTASADDTARLWDGRTGKPLGTPLRHMNNVESAAFSPDGSRVVTASDDRTAQLWDIASGQPLGAPFRHNDGVTSATFSPDGSCIVTTSEDTTARLWDAATGQLIAAPLQHQGKVLGAAFSPDGSRVVTASNDHYELEGEARLWDAATGQPRSAPLRHKKTLASVAFSPDGSRIVTASGDGTARLWDAATGEPLGDPLNHKSAVASAAFSPDGMRVLTASWDHTARLWDAATGQPLGAPLGHEREVRSAAFSSDGSRIVTASGDKTARLWDAAAVQSVGAVLRHEHGIESADFSPDGSLVVTASEDHTAQVWNAANAQPLGSPLQHDHSVSNASFSPDGSRVITVGLHHTVRFWNAATGRPGPTLRHKSGFRSAVFSHDGSRVVTANNDGIAQLWDAATGEPIGAPLQHKDTVWHAVFSPDSSRVLTSSGKTARLWDAATSQPVGALLQHKLSVWRSAFSPDGSRVVTASQDATARVWDAATGQPLCDPLRHESGLSSAVFSLDGTRLLTASEDTTARLWDAATGKLLGVPLRHKESVSRAAFSPDGSHVITVSGDTAWLWDTATFQPIGTPFRHNHFIWSAAFSPDSSRVVTASKDGTARLWDIPAVIQFDSRHGWNGWGSSRGAWPVIEAVSGYRFTEAGELIELSMAERITRLDSASEVLREQPDWAQLYAWWSVRPSQRTASPVSALTRRAISDLKLRDIAWWRARRTASPLNALTRSVIETNPRVTRAESLREAMIDLHLRGIVAESVREVMAAEPGHPLLQIAAAQVEENGTRADFLRDYGLKRLAADATVCARAAAMLAEQEDFSRALQAADNALALDPKNVSALQTRLIALGKIGRKAEAEELPGQHPELQPKPARK